MLSMGSMKLFKTIVLEENHTNDETGNAQYWYNFFGEYIDTNSTLICVFTNNDSSGSPTPQYFVNIIAYACDTNNGVRTWNVRSSYFNEAIGTSNQRSLWASQGTVIKLYRIPKN